MSDPFHVAYAAHDDGVHLTDVDGRTAVLTVYMLRAVLFDARDRETLRRRFGELIPPYTVTDKES